MTSANRNRQHRTSSAPSDSKRAARGKCKRQFITFIICVFLVGGIAGGLIVGVVLVFNKERMRAKCCIQVVQQHDV